MKHLNKVLFIVISYITVQIVDSLTNILDWILVTLSLPFIFITSFNVEDLATFYKWGLLLLYVCLYWGLIMAIVYLWNTILKKEKAIFEGESITSLCESELSDLINAIEANESRNKVKDSTVRLLKEFERGVTKMFGLGKGEYKCLWAFPSKEDDNLCILTIENEVTREEAEIFEWALGSKKHHFYSNDIKDNFHGVVKEMAFTRNLGEFRLGFAILINKENVVTQEKRKIFKTASSYLLLLGHIDKLTQEMVQLYQD